MTKLSIFSVQHSAHLFFLLLIANFISGCSTTNAKPETLIEPIYTAEHVIKDDTQSATDIYDPWESFNRKMYVFNYHFDNTIFLPAVDGYEYIMPDFAEDMVSNFFLNLGDITNILNSALQLKGKEFVTSTGRFLVNSTLGLFGFFDPATAMEMNRANEDFGQTLGHYGVDAGPYLVLPILGPSSLRDTTGLVFDGIVDAKIISEGLDELHLSGDDETLITSALTVIQALDTRHRTAFRYYDSGSPFEYELVRLLYKTKRDLDVAK